MDAAKYVRRILVLAQVGESIPTWPRRWGGVMRRQMVANLVFAFGLAMVFVGAGVVGVSATSPSGGDHKVPSTYSTPLSSPGGGASTTLPTGGVSGANTETTPPGEELANTGETATGEVLGVFLVAVGLCCLSAGVVMWR